MAAEYWFNSCPEKKNVTHQNSYKMSSGRVSREEKAKNMNVCSHSSTPTVVSAARCLIKHKEKFVLTLHDWVTTGTPTVST
jgi:hypothetical protein